MNFQNTDWNTTTEPWVTCDERGHTIPVGTRNFFPRKILTFIYFIIIHLYTCFCNILSPIWNHLCKLPVIFAVLLQRGLVDLTVVRAESMAYEQKHVKFFLGCP